MGSRTEDLPDWGRLLAAERHLQHRVPGAVLVGGTAAAVHAGHRVSMDIVEVDVRGYRGLRPSWDDWQHVVERGRRWAQVAARVALEERP